MFDFKPEHLVCIDFETFYSQGYTLSKFTTEEYARAGEFEVIGVGVHDGEQSAWLEEEDFRAWTKEVDWSKCAVLSHNSAFDSFILSHHYPDVKPGIWFDTLSMARALHGSEVGGSLKKLAEYYQVGEKGDEVVRAIGKRRADFTREEWLRYGDYCLQDVKLCLAIFDKMVDRFPDSELWLIDTTLRMFTEGKLLIDEPKLAAFIVDEKKRKAGLLERVAEDKTTLLSNDKFAALLVDMGIEPPTKISDAKTRTARKKDPDAEPVMTWALAKSDPGMQALLEHERDDIRWLAEARVGVKSTINETRAERFLRMGKGGRALPVPLKYWGAHTGRWAGSERVNFQNLQRGGVLRDCLLAPKGQVIVAADSGQIEARITAWLAGHDELIEIFASGRDVYCEFGSSVFGREITKEDKRERFISKSMILGLGYGMGWQKMSSVFLASTERVQFTEEDAEDLGVSLGRFLGDEAKMARVEAMPSRLPLEERAIHCAVSEALVWKYRNKNKPITELWKLMERVIAAMVDGEEAEFGPGGCLKTLRHGVLLPSGMVLRYPGLSRHDEEGGRRSYSYLGGRYTKERTRIYGGSAAENLVQAVARIVVAEQMLKIREMGLPIVTMAHDEVAVVVDEQDGQAALDAMIGVMKTPPAWAIGMPLNADGGFGKSYGEAK